MSLSNEWTEYHLTPQGWVEGSTRLDVIGTTIREPPTDRVETYRYSVEVPSIGAKAHRGGTITWQSPDISRIAELRQQFGEPPDLI